MKKLIAAMLIITAMFSGAGCTRNVNGPTPPPVVSPQDSVVTGLRVAFNALTIGAAAQMSYVDSLKADKQITKKEAEEFKKWTKNVPKLSAAALVILSESKPADEKLLAVAKVVNEFQRPVILSTMSPKTKAAYMAVTALLEGIEAQLSIQPTR